MRFEDMVLFSVDDHIIEPSTVFEGRMASKFTDVAPRHFAGEEGGDYWMIGGKKVEYIGSNAVVGRPRHEYGFEPSALDQMRPGCYDVDARIGDMNVNGLAASVNFGTITGMAGERFLAIEDKELALAVCQAWNDWHLEDWCGKYPDRLVPLANLPMWDPVEAAKEVRRMKAKGCNTISFHPNPVALGLPSFHTEHWDPIWQACVEEDVTICLHFADSSYAVPSLDSPVEVMISNMPIGLYRVASDLTFSHVLRKYPTIQFAMSESGAGWVPYMKQRIDCTYKLHNAWTRQSFGDMMPSELFDRNFATSFIDDPIGLAIRHEIGIKNLTWETDYPHADCIWPEAPEKLWKDLQGANVPDDEIEAITHLNACRLFKHDLFKNMKREELTVGALRAKAKEAGVSTEIMNTDGAGVAPSQDDSRPVIMRDVFKQMATKNEAFEESIH